MNKSRLRSLFPGLVTFFALAHLTHHLVTALPVPLLPFIRDEFALDYTQAGIVISAFGVVYGIFQLPAGWLADRIGPRLLITIVGICGVAVTGFLIGLSQTYTMLIIFLVLMGILGGGYHPAATTMISAAVEPDKRGRALGVHMIGGSTSYFLVPIIAAASATLWGWRGTFIGLAIPTLIFGIIFYLLLGRRVAIKIAKQKTTDRDGEISPPSNRLRRLVTIIVLSTFTQAVILSTVSFIPLYLVDNFGVDKELAAASMALVYSVGLWAGPLGGYMSDRLGRLPIILAMCFVTGPVIYLLNLVPYGLGTGAVLIIIGTIIYFNTTVTQAYIVDHTTERNRSTVLGLYFFGTMEGSGLLPPAIGYLIDQFGFHSSLTIIGAAVLAVTLIGYTFYALSRD
ncbi:MAG: MFS transporter [Dehalococcoidales bacterium]